jgi:hypothetical protein
MLSVSATLEAAIEALVRRPIARVLVDWHSRTAITLPAGGSTFETLPIEFGTLTSGGASLSLSQSSTQAHSGTYSMRMLHNNSAGTGKARMTVDGFRVGYDYTVTAWMFVPTGVPAHILTVEDASNPASVVLFTGTDTGAVKDTWVQLSVTFTATTTSYRICLANVTVPTAGQSAYVDDVAVNPAGVLYRDLSDAVASVRVSRTLTSDLPAETNLVVGGTATQVTLGLAGDVEGQPVGHVLNPHQGLMPDASRMGAPVTLDLGMVTDAGPERLRQFTGRVRDGTVGGPREASLVALDGPEILNAAVTVPPIAGRDPVGTGKFQGAELNFLLDYVMRRNGWYQSLGPHPSGETRLLATLSGSAYAEVGGPTAPYFFIHDEASNTGTLPEFVDGSRGRAVKVPDAVTNGPYSRNQWWLTSQVSTGGALRLLLETEQMYVAGPNNTGNVFVMMLYMNSVTTSPTDWLYLTHNFTTNQWQVHIARGSGAPTANTGTFIIGTLACPLGTPFYLAMQADYTASVVNVTVRVGSTTMSGNIVMGIGNGAGHLDAVQTPSQLPGGGWVSGIHFTKMTTFDSDLYRDATAPGPVPDLDPCKSELVATMPAESVQSWALLQDLATAEGGLFFLSEDGVPTFWNRDRMTSQVSAVRTISADLSLKSLATAEAIDTVRNVVKVTAAPPQVDRADDIIWAASEVLMVPAAGSLAVPMEFPGVALSVDTSLIYYSGSTGVASGSGYRAAKGNDGTGGDVSNLGFTWDLSASRATLTVTNPNGFDVFLVENGLASTTRGRPMLQIVGRAARPTQNPYVVVRRDEASVDAYGEQVLEVPASEWRQNTEAAEDLADHLLDRLRVPRPVIPSVAAVGDPRTQVGDRVTIIDSAGIGLARDYFVVGVDRTLDSSGLSDTYAVREAGHATSGMTGTFVLGTSELDGMDGLA